MGKILIVDDSVTVRLYHKQILQSGGFEVDEAENGMEALEKVSETEYDLFLVDINMPILDGYTFVQRLREDIGFSKIVIMISTEAEIQDKTQAYSSGANYYKVKPVNTNDLLNSVNLLIQEQ
jgi:two-component system chemotaxis response regulator CheY